MRFHLRLMALFLVSFLLAACSSSTTEPSLVLQADSASLQTGESFTVTVQANNISNLTAFEVHLAFDPSLLEVVLVESGEFLRPDFLVQNTFDNAAGTLDYAAAQLESPAAQGSGGLLIVTFRARGQGNALIDFRPTPAATLGALLADADGLSIPVALESASLKITP
jgi:hypothetical protein